MVSIAQELAKDYKAEEEIVIIASLLHDLAGIEDQNKKKEHHVYGAERAGELLKRYGYEQNKINKVKKCIYNHRGSINNPKGTIEEICVADADAIAHIQEIGSLFYVAYVKMEMGIDEGSNWIISKIERDWNKMSIKGQNNFKGKFEEIKRVISINV